ncbi:hypothetical protein SAMN04490239_1627 [Rhodococcus koreensis]|uniref:Uncharacterized protein n=1 Tax=Rhodococcus koreensis TaxID=99653 RepID=A0A1H4M4B9_9NOCA|nr:hypothetical protein SAMN04490239_1627 [Rhodococcus koreensis]
MVAFEVRWCAHGGGPAETIMADFGMDAAAFFRQLTEYLENSPPTPLRPDVVERMKGRYAAAPLAGHLTGPEPGLTCRTTRITANRPVYRSVRVATAVTIGRRSWGIVASLRQSRISDYRTRDDLGDLADLVSITDTQLQPALVVTRDAYLRLYPDDETKIRLARWVVINGSSGGSSWVASRMPRLFMASVWPASAARSYQCRAAPRSAMTQPEADRGAIAREFMDEMGFTETSGRSPPLGRGSRFATACPRMEMTATTSPPPRCARMA